MKRVVVGLSGGLDSAMSAYLLQRDGYEVIGVTMSTWDENLTDERAIKSGCFGPGEAEDIESAALICEALKIPYHVIDLKREYRKNVLDYFHDEYIKGKTPNPCVLCNQQMKFGLLPAKAEEILGGYDYFATGHYVRKVEDQSLFYLAQAKDRGKDQTYFLCRLVQDQIKRLLFPLGLYLKSEVRQIAEQAGFSELALRKESQDFLETEDYDYIFDEDVIQAGEVVDQDGNVLGKHRGIMFYTVGQRRGLAVSGQKEPVYVTGIDAEKNRVVVGPKGLLYGKSLIARGVVWSDGQTRDSKMMLSAKIRLQHEAAPCIVEPLSDNDYRVEFQEPQLSITPGQIIAFYQEDILLGGGFIEPSN